MSDEDLGRLLRGILNFVKAGFVIGLFTLGILVMTHWDKALLKHGLRIVSEAPTAQSARTAEASTQNEAPPRRPVPLRRRARSHRPAVEEQAAPVTATPASMVAPMSAAPVVVVVVAAPQEKHFLAHHKGHGGCDGDLIFTDTSLRFDCPSRPGEPLNFSRDAVRADDDGIRDLASGRPYHFKIGAMSKPQARALFSEWVSQGNSAAVQP